MSKSAPAIPLFGDAYLADTRHLSLEEHGAYLQLLMIAWRSPNCALPDDDARLARMLGVTGKKWATLRPSVMAFWTLTVDGWEQKRLSKERRFVAKKSEHNRDAANARWNDKPLKTHEAVDANAVPNGCGNDAPPPTPKKEEERKKKVTASGDAVPLVFEGKVIRLNERDFTSWEKNYPDIALRASLQARDDWLENEADAQTRRKWFISTSNYLANLQQKAVAAKRAPEYDRDRITV